MASDYEILATYVAGSIGEIKSDIEDDLDDLVADGASLALCYNAETRKYEAILVVWDMVRDERMVKE